MNTNSNSYTIIYASVMVVIVAFLLAFVTSARTETGKYIFGFLIGAMAIIIRVLNPGYPEGMMLAILLMNIFAPLIDYCVVQGNISRREKRAIKSNN